MPNARAMPPGIQQTKVWKCYGWFGKTKNNMNPNYQLEQWGLGASKSPPWTRFRTTSSAFKSTDQHAG